MMCLIRQLRQGHRPHYYRYLLLALVLSMVLMPETSDWMPGRFIEAAVILGLLTAGSLAVSDTRADSIFSVVMSLTMIVVGVVRFSGHDSDAVTLSWLLVGVVFFSHVTFVLAQDIFTSRGHIDSGRLYGAVSLYLLMGLIFANLHYALETISPGSYQCGSPQCQGDYKPPVFLYFSFITLCSVGYGDILPATRMAGMLAYLEAVAGQMYLAILVARLVGMHLSSAKH